METENEDIILGDIIVEEEIEIGDIEFDVEKIYPALEPLTVTPSEKKQVFNHPNSYGYDEVIVNEVQGEELSVTPTTEEQINEGVYTKVTTKAIESEELNIMPSTENQVKEGMFNKVTVAGDKNLDPKNILKGRSIFGVDGQAQGLIQGAFKGETNELKNTIKNASIEEFSVSGKSEQEKRTGKNLFKGVIESGLLLATNGTTYEKSDSYVCSRNYVDVRGLTEITVSSKNNLVGVYYILQYDKTAAYIGEQHSTYQTSFSAQLKENTAYVRVEMGNSANKPTVETLGDFQVEAGMTKTKYERYGIGPSIEYSCELKAIEGNIEVLATKNNVINVNNPNTCKGNWKVDENNIGKLTTNNAWQDVIWFAPVIEGEQYNFSYSERNGSSLFLFIGEYDEISDTATPTREIVADGIKTSYTFTIQKTGYLRVRFALSVKGEIEIPNPQLRIAQSVIFPLEGQKLIEDSYLAEDGIYHVRGQRIVSGTTVTLENAKENGEYLCTVKEAGTLEGKTINFESEVTDVLIEYELAEEIIEPYSTEQQKAYNQLEMLTTYEDITYVTTTHELKPILTGKYYMEPVEPTEAKITNAQNLFSQGVRLDYLYELLKLCENISNASSMFNSCNTLSELNLRGLDTSNVKSMQSMFYGCMELENLILGDFDTRNVTHFNTFMYNCSKVKTLPRLNLSSAVNITNIVMYCSDLTDLGGFKDLGKAYVQKSNNYSAYKLDLSQCKKLTHQSLMNVINNLYDLNLTYDVANGGTLYTQSLVLGSTNIAKLTAEEIKIATDKGWTVS